MIVFIGVVLAAAWLIAAYRADWRRLAAMPQIAPPAAHPEQPMISLLIPARNEERVIARCVRSALAQHYPHFEVIVVDDGSTDRTAQILAEFSADPRLRILRGRPLPTGWIGKCNVCQQLADQAQGEWLLFLDADTAAGPNLLPRLLAHARSRQLDLVTVFPFLELGSFWERLILPPFMALIVALFPFERMMQPDVRADEVLANGQCIFVRRSAYNAAGGHAAVRNEILEDVRLAQAIRAAGFRVGGGAALEDLTVRMYTNGSEVRSGLMKNAAAGYRSGGERSWSAASRLIMQAWGPLWLLIAALLQLRLEGGLLAWLTLAAALLAYLAGLTLWGSLYRRLYRQNPLWALLWPLGIVGYFLIAIQGIRRVQRGRGVVWKGRSYEG